jgi:DNA ligase (NAD+)
MNQRINELVKTLNTHSHQYYTLDTPTISDGEYDALYDELVILENETGIVLENSPTLRVGGDVLSHFVKHNHLSALYSLDKAQSIDEIFAWEKRAKKVSNQDFKYTLEYKFDGLTINLTYDKGKLVTAATRGNGATGENVTEQIKTIKSVPLTVPYLGKFEAQGEGIMRLSTLKAYNKKADVPLKNARNGVAGAIRNLDPKVTAKRNLDCFIYNVGYIEGMAFETHTEMIGFLKDNGFKVSDYFKTYADINPLAKELEVVTEAKGDLDFLIDGMVIKIDDIETRRILGNTAKFPRWAVAFKFEAEEATTTIEKVVWNVGRTGKLTPLAHLTPVDIGGATVSRATLNNYGDITRKKVKVGGRVFIRRSNDVIPEVLGNADDAGVKIEKPTVCPDCGYALIEDGAHLFCRNTFSCKPQLISTLAHFASRDAMDIETFSEKTAQTLIEKMGVKNVADLYHLDYEKLVSLEGFKDKKVDNIKNAIEMSKTPTLDRFIYALGIPNVGKKTAKDLAKTFHSFEKIKSADIASLVAIDEVGDIIAQSIVDFFSHIDYNDIVQKLFDWGVNPIDAVDDTIFNQNISGKTFVLTGTLKKLKRSEAATMIEKNGGKTSATVSKKTDCVLAGENAGSKLDKAQKLGVKVVDEAEFLSWF